jgi:hypothetical protein
MGSVTIALNAKLFRDGEISEADRIPIQQNILVLIGKRYPVMD